MEETFQELVQERSWRLSGAEYGKLWNPRYDTDFSRIVLDANIYTMNNRRSDSDEKGILGDTVPLELNAGNWYTETIKTVN